MENECTARAPRGAPRAPRLRLPLRQTHACTRRAAPKRTYVTKKLPVPHPSHNCCNTALQHYVQANFCMFWRSSLPVRGISSCGIEAPSNLAPHLEQLRMLALWGRLWSRLGFSHVVMVSTPGLNSRRRQLLAVPARPEWHNTAASATPCATLRDPPYGVLWCASQESSTRQHNKSLIGGTIGAFRSGRRVAEGAELLPGTAATFNSSTYRIPTVSIDIVPLSLLATVKGQTRRHKSYNPSSQQRYMQPPST